MLEFYYKFYNNQQFRVRSKKLAFEIESIFFEERISISKSNDICIPLEFKDVLGEELFFRLSNIYFSIRDNSGENHFLFRKYLPELKKEPKSEMQFADFFSGAGGLGQGLVNAGFEPAFVNDNYLDALETYYFNHFLVLDRFFNINIQDLCTNFEKYKHLFKNIKVIAGGPPCQGFSKANRRNYVIDSESKEKRFIEDKRNILYKSFVELLGAIKPDFFIMENVKGMKNVEREIEQDINNKTNQGYSFFPFNVDAQSFNIPQSRQRYILIGGKNFMFIESVKTNINRKKYYKSSYKLKDALFGLPMLKTNPVIRDTESESDAHGFFLKKTTVSQNDFLREINDDKNCNYLFNHKSRYNNENDLEIFKRLPEGGNSLHESIQELSKYTNRNHIFSDKYYKLKSDEVSKTITSHMKYDCHMYIHPSQPRGLSPREAARIQTFSDDYVFRGALNSWYKQIGNAVPVKLAQVIGNELKNFYK
ncbi:DNA cytosine methyltransferase [Pedobacter caeni]|uniref:Cytosine-specific methyltransferase n=1 Tax=Pedobacter caeni TaxID=288992 RepID=A0A1M5JNC4_9SPHI|nr:DNA cytosine methyltransferase [Pedobacter caeni]SHG42028.1 DNA (cytosine-5)-methyltransferase 1 [Pedobacter caeni]